MKDPEGKIAKEIKAYLNFRGKQCIIQERQGKESLRSYKYTNANLIPDVFWWLAGTARFYRRPET